MSPEVDNSTDNNEFYVDTTFSKYEHTPEVLQDMYLHMEFALPPDDEGPDFARVTKQLRDANGLFIGIADDNPLLDTSLYEVDYLDGYKALVQTPLLRICL